jgi:uncharacterized protein (DUF1684 family)
MFRASLCLLAALPLRAADATYRAEIERWRAGVERSLKADDGWLTVAGLFWLKEGENRIDLPESSGPAQSIVFEFHGGKTTARMAGGAAKEMKPDTSGKPDIVVIGGVSLFVIQRGDRYGVRLRDKNSRFRKDFTGCKWFPVREGARVEARFVPYTPPKMVTIPNVLGQKEQMPSPGRVVFTWQGQEVSLEPVSEGRQLWFIFKDRTSGKETYPAGRFLYAPAPVGGKVVIDFNRATNPPCAFTPYATCPLPPRQNWLPVRIDAGEMTYHAE